MSSKQVENSAPASKPAKHGSSGDTGAPWPGSHQMPQWTVNELPEAPVFTWRNILGMLGPGLVMGAAAIGGGEWTLGPKVTAQYGGSILWLATLSILFQVTYNIEICRYTLYSGEPIFTGKFRLLPGPIFWVCLYVLVDWGSFFPYLLTNAAMPLYALLWGMPPPDMNAVPAAWWSHKILTLTLFVLMLVPLIFGGKVYNSLKVIMSFKLVYVLGLLVFLGVFYAHGSSWVSIIRGFGEFGTLPLKMEPPAPALVAKAKPKPEMVNVFGYFGEKGHWPTLDLSQVAFLCALAAIAGNGGLTNAPISNFVRDQGWGMGKHVGAIPSVIGGQGIELSHEGAVFLVKSSSMERWRKWVWHVAREQIFVWLPACFIGVALPSILSVEFLPPGTDAGDWNLSTMTAEGVENTILSPPSDVLASKVGIAQTLATPQISRVFFGLILFCGFIVLITSGVSTADGFTRRWVDLIWVGIPKLREMDKSFIKYVYFSVLMIYAVIGFSILCLPQAPGIVVKLATTGYNFAFAFSCLHTLGVNLILLPWELRPNWVSRILLVLGSIFFGFLGVMGTLSLAGQFSKPCEIIYVVRDEAGDILDASQLESVQAAPGEEMQPAARIVELADGTTREVTGLTSHKETGGKPVTLSELKVTRDGKTMRLLFNLRLTEEIRAIDSLPFEEGEFKLLKGKWTKVEP